MIKESVLTQHEIENDEEDIYTTYEITSYPAFYTLEDYAKKYSKDNGTFIVPDFQRYPIWDVKKQSKLIESFLMGLPVPPIFLYTEKGSRFKIIDGLQRVHTIFSFLNNGFVLTGLNNKSPFYNKKFNDFDVEDKIKLQNTILQATIIRQINPIDDSSIYLIFERLNTGGEKLNNMEVRRCIGYGSFLSQLANVNTCESWRKILGEKEAHKRFLDLELVLRVFALYEWEYFGPMKQFLNFYMEKNKDRDKEDICHLFIESCNKIINELGEKPFSIKAGKPNLMLLDSVLVALMSTPDLKGLKEKFDILMNNNTYKAIYGAGQGTASTKSVKERIKIAKEILK